MGDPGDGAGGVRELDRGVGGGGRAVGRAAGVPRAGRTAGRRSSGTRWGMRAVGPCVRAFQGLIGSDALEAAVALAERGGLSSAWRWLVKGQPARRAENGRSLVGAASPWGCGFAPLGQATLKTQSREMRFSEIDVCRASSGGNRTLARVHHVHRVRERCPHSPGVAAKRPGLGHITGHRHRHRHRKLRHLCAAAPIRHPDG